MQTKTIVIAGLSLFFGTVIAVNATMIVLSMRTADGLVVDHEYSKALHYDDVIQQRKRQATYGWRVTLKAPGDRIGPVTVEARDADDRPLDGATVAVTFLRPTQDGLDQSISLQETDAGRYGADVNLPLIGMWDAQVTIRQGERLFQQTERVWVGGS